MLCDEFIAHRLGLIPLVSSGTVQSLSFPWEDVAGDEEDIRLTLDVKCHEGTLDVMSSDLHSSDPRVIPVGARADNLPKQLAPGIDSKDDIIICKLRKNQELKLSCIARKGVGRDHAKFSPVSTAVFRYEADIRLNEPLLDTLTDEEKQELVAAQPRNLLDPSQPGVFRLNEETRRVELEAPELYAYDQEILKKAEEMGYPDAIEVEQKLDSFLFTVESTGALRPEEIVLTALDVLATKMDTIRGESISAVENVAMQY